MDQYMQLWLGSMLCIGIASILVWFIIRPPKEGQGYSTIVEGGGRC